MDIDYYKFILRDVETAKELEEKINILIATRQVNSVSSEQMNDLLENFKNITTERQRIHIVMSAMFTVTHLMAADHENIAKSIHSQYSAPKITIYAALTFLFCLAVFAWNSYLMYIHDSFSIVNMRVIIFASIVAGYLVKFSSRKKTQ